MPKIIAMCCCLLALTGCMSGGQKVFYWERPNTGVTWFVRDHGQCLEESDYWPFTRPGWPPFSGAEPKLKLRFDNDADNGIWADFIPFPGAHPVKVNSVHGDWSMSYDVYEACMEQRGYIQRRPPSQSNQVFYQ